MKRLLLAAALMVGPAARAQKPEGLYSAPDRPAKEGRFGGAVIIRDATGVRFARLPGLEGAWKQASFPA